MKYLLFVFCSIFSFSYNASAQQSDSLLAFLKTHPDRSSLYLIKNDTVVARLNEQKMMPLASTMKIVVAIEFAKQAAFHVFDTSEMVALKELNKYYIPFTDGGAHTQWLAFEKSQGNINNDSVPLIHVARGMMMFSSNANTEYLMELLGLQNINGNYRLMGISHYTPLYYYVSALFLYQNPKKLNEGKILKQIKNLSQEAYIASCNVIHEQLRNNPAYKSQFRMPDLTLQKIWSDRLPASTTMAYARIAQVLNSRSIFSEKTYQILSRVLETIMENPRNQQWLSHAGMKGGSTGSVLTKASYATLKNGKKIALAYFFDNLDQAEVNKIAGWMNAFEIKVLQDDDFIKKLSEL